MKSPLFLLVLVAACEPPPLSSGSGQPSIEIIAPPTDVGQIALQPDGTLKFLLAVDLDGIQYVRPSESQADPVEGQGHYHFHLNGEYLGPPEEQLIEYVSDVDEFSAGSAMQLRVTLASNDHVDLDEFDDWEAIVEFDVVAP